MEGEVRQEEGSLMLQVGESISIRPLEKRDVDTLQIWDRDPELLDLMGLSAENAPEPSEWYDKMSSNRNNVLMVIEREDGRLIGDIELTEIAWRSGEAELVVRIGEKDCWGRGYGEKAINAILDMAFSQFKLRRIYLRVCAENTRAMRCYKKCGFKVQGKVKRQKTIYSEFEDMTLILMAIDNNMFYKNLE